jgi:hypothetical protein
MYGQPIQTDEFKIGLETEDQALLAKSVASYLKLRNAELCFYTLESEL